MSERPCTTNSTIPRCMTTIAGMVVVGQGLGVPRPSSSGSRPEQRSLLNHTTTTSSRSPEIVLRIFMGLPSGQQRHSVGDEFTFGLQRSVGHTARVPCFSACFSTAGACDCPSLQLQTSDAASRGAPVIVIRTSEISRLLPVYDLHRVCYTILRPHQTITASRHALHHCKPKRRRNIAVERWQF